MRLERPDTINYEERDLSEKHSLHDLAQDYSMALRSLLEDMLSTDPEERPSPQAIIEWFYESKIEWKEMATAPSCNDLDLYPSWLHWSPSGDYQINDFFSDVPSLPKKKKGKNNIEDLSGPSSSDEDSSDDDEDDEQEGPRKGKKGVVVVPSVDDHDHDIPDASGAYPENEDYEDEYGEEDEEGYEEYDEEDEENQEDEEDEAEEESEDEDEEDEEGDEGGEEEAGDYDEDDPMQGSSGPDLTSGSEYALPSEDEDMMSGVSRGSGRF